MTRPTTTAAHVPTGGESGSAPVTRLRAPALVAGIATLLLAVLAGWANFTVVEPLPSGHSPVRTAQDILASRSAFRLGVAALLVAAMLDVVVAWAQRAFFKPAHRRVATIAAWLRTVYAGIFAVAVAHLGGALEALTSTGTSTRGRTDAAVEAMQRIETFHTIWDVGLVLFGLHLALVGYLALRASYVPRLVGWLVVTAAAGYLLDTTVALLAPESLPEIGLVTFIGEVVLLGWLLTRGRNVVLPQSGPRPQRGREPSRHGPAADERPAPGICRTTSPSQSPREGALRGVTSSQDHAHAV